MSNQIMQSVAKERAANRNRRRPRRAVRKKLKLQPLDSALKPMGESFFAYSKDISAKGFAFQANDYIDFGMLDVTIVDEQVTYSARIQHVYRNHDDTFRFTVGCEYKTKQELKESLSS